MKQCWSEQAVKGWSEAKLRAWEGRRANPNELFYWFPKPGEAQATGQFTSDEQRLFKQRVAEFEKNNLPLSCWGLFSLGIPGRVGYQCCAYYRKHVGAEQEGTRTTAAESATCLALHAAQLEQIWQSPTVQRVSMQVDQWVEQIKAAQRQEASGQRAPAVAPARASGAATGAGLVQGRQQQGVRRELLPCPDSDSDFEDNPMAASGRPAKAAAQEGVAGAGGSSGGGAGKLAVAVATGPSAEVGQPQPPGKNSQGQAAPLPSSGSLPWRLQRGTGSTKAAQQPCTSRPLQQASSKPIKGSAAGCGNRAAAAAEQRAGPVEPSRRPGSKPRTGAPAAEWPGTAAATAYPESDSDSEFVAGSLRQAPLPVAAASAAAAPGLPSSEAPKLPKPGMKRKRVWKSAAAAVLASEASAAADLGSQVVSIKLQQGGDAHMPGWAPRLVAPYQPQQQQQQQQQSAALIPAAIGSGSAAEEQARCTAYLEVADVATTAGQVAEAGPPFQAALISPGWLAQEGQPADPLQRLSRLPLPKLVPSGFVFIWAQKQHIQQTVRQMNRWGYAYVENLTWVWLSPGNSILQLPSPLISSSHLTLFIFRREGEGKDIELRHQRTADVAFACPASQPSGDPGVPAEVFEAIETLLPTGKGKFLELWAPGGARRAGWTHVVERAAVGSGG